MMINIIRAAAATAALWVEINLWWFGQLLVNSIDWVSD